MKIKTADLVGAALDWAVAECENVTPLIAYDSDGKNPQIFDSELIEMGVDDGADFSPSTDWVRGGPIIEREGIELKRGYGKPLLWAAFAYDCHNNVRTSAGKTGSTPLIAAMRCFVASKLGDEVDVPEELCTS